MLRIFLILFVVVCFGAGKPAFAQVNIDRSRCTLGSDPAEAIAACSRLLYAATGKDRAGLLVHRGRNHAHNKKFEEALADFDAAAELDPTNPNVFAARAQVEHGKSSGSPRAFRDLSMYLRLGGDPTGAVLKEILAGNPVLLPLLFACAGDADAALREFDAQLKDSPTSDSRIVRGLVALSAGRYESALADLQEAKLGADDAIVRILQGEIFRLMRDYAKALEVLSKPVDRTPEKNWLLALRGDVWRDRGNLDQAIADYDFALQSSDTLVYIYAHAARGAAHESKGNREKAREDYLKVLGAPIHEIETAFSKCAENFALGQRAKAPRETALARLAALDNPASAQAAPQTAPVASAPLAAKPQAVSPPPIASPPPAAALPPAVPALPAVAPDPGRRVALVIGNARYRNATVLQNPQSDATAVAESLRKLGFQKVELEFDLTRDRLLDTLRNFAREAESAHWALIYFAGHGIEMNGINYLIPVDARLAVDRDVDFEAVAIDKVMSAVDGAKKLRLVLLDACRDNPFVSQMRRSIASRSIGRGLAQIEPEAGTLVVYAAKHGQTALDGEGGNSPFAAALLERMKTPGLEIRRLFDLVRDDVMVATNRRQQPFSYGSVSGSEDFFFLTQR